VVLSTPPAQPANVSVKLLPGTPVKPVVQAAEPEAQSKPPKGVVVPSRLVMLGSANAAPLKTVAPAIESAAAIFFKFMSTLLTL